MTMLPRGALFTVLGGREGPELRASLLQLHRLEVVARRYITMANNLLWQLPIAWR